jgi:hypothetical protein
MKTSHRFKTLARVIALGVAFTGMSAFAAQSLAAPASTLMVNKKTLYFVYLHPDKVVASYNGKKISNDQVYQVVHNVIVAENAYRKNDDLSGIADTSLAPAFVRMSQNSAGVDHACVVVHLRSGDGSAYPIIYSGPKADVTQWASCDVTNNARTYPKL